MVVGVTPLVYGELGIYYLSARGHRGCHHANYTDLRLLQPVVNAFPIATSDRLCPWPAMSSTTGSAFERLPARRHVQKHHERPAGSAACTALGTEQPDSASIRRYIADFCRILRTDQRSHKSAQQLSAASQFNRNGRARCQNYFDTAGNPDFHRTIFGGVSVFRLRPTAPFSRGLRVPQRGLGRTISTIVPDTTRASALPAPANSRILAERGSRRVGAFLAEFPRATARPRQGWPRTRSVRPRARRHFLQGLIDLPRNRTTVFARTR